MSEPSDPPLREVIRRHNLWARRALGQNFLLNSNLLEKIARAAGPFLQGPVLEVGPGPGGLTRALLKEGVEHIIAVERDARFLPALEELSQAYPGRLTVHHKDARHLSLETVKPTKIVSNLPFNVATPLIVGWLGGEVWPPCFESITVMVQKEVAQRILAPCGTRAYGRLSVLCQWRAHLKHILDIPKEAFTPSPRVTSSVIQFTPRIKPFPCDRDILQRVVASAFQQRRKTLRTSLRSIGNGKHEVTRLAERIGIDLGQRAEQLRVEDFCALARAVAESSG